MQAPEPGGEGGFISIVSLFLASYMRSPWLPGRQCLTANPASCYTAKNLR